MTREEIRQTVIGALSDIAPETDPGTTDPRADLREALDIDSMDFLNFVIALHKRLQVEIPEADYPKLLTVAGATDYLAVKLGA
ncbi:MAG: acyl carrier protein [Tistlia sp.]|uniref:acyl carrier protein n=1 Tax=Tistlia sp. TaxID=3057121 RepID=UPI0034A477D9